MPQPDVAPVAVFDLDGTILRINSFPAWVIHLIAGRPPGLLLRQRLRLSLRTQDLLLRRKFGNMRHDEFLLGLQRACRSAGSALHPMARFEAWLLRHVRQNLAPVLRQVEAGELDAVLATAAAADYAFGLGRRLGFQHVIATEFGRLEGEPCNSGEQKRKNVLAFLRQRGWSARPIVLFTDHRDDLPLMRISSAVCWFGPEARLAEAREQAAGARFLFCRDMTATEMHAAFEALCLPQPPPAHAAPLRANIVS